MFTIMLPFWEASARDLSMPQVQPVIQKLQASATTLAVTATYDVPSDQALMLQGWTMQIQPGAAEFAQFAFLVLQNSGGVTLGALFSARANGAAFGLQGDGVQPPTAAGANVAFNRTGSWLIAPGTRIVAQATKNAAVQSCQIDLDLYGVLVPKGNLPRL